MTPDAGRGCEGLKGQFTARVTSSAGCTGSAINPFEVAFVNQADGGIQLLLNGSSSPGETVTRDSVDACMLSARSTALPTILTYDPPSDSLRGTAMRSATCTLEWKLTR